MITRRVVVVVLADFVAPVAGVILILAAAGATTLTWLLLLLCPGKLTSHGDRSLPPPLTVFTTGGVGCVAAEETCVTMTTLAAGLLG